MKNNEKNKEWEKWLNVLVVTIIAFFMAGITGTGAFFMTGSLFMCAIFGFLSGLITIGFFNFSNKLRELEEEKKKTAKNRHPKRKSTHRKKK